MGTGDEYQGEGTEASSLGNGHLTDGHRSRNIWSPAATATTAGSYGGLSSLWPLPAVGHTTAPCFDYTTEALSQRCTT